MNSPLMTAADVLREARRLIAEKGWCQKSYARDSRGRQVPENSEKACRFCMSGALWRVAAGRDAVYLGARTYIDVPMVSFNDTRGRTKDEVLAALDRAIALAESPGDHP